MIILLVCLSTLGTNDGGYVGTELQFCEPNTIIPADFPQDAWIDNGWLYWKPYHGEVRYCVILGNPDPNKVEMVELISESKHTMMMKALDNLVTNWLTECGDYNQDGKGDNVDYALVMRLLGESI